MYSWFLGIVVVKRTRAYALRIRDWCSDVCSAALRRRLKRLMRTCLVTIERGQIYQFPLRKRPVDTIISAVRAANPDAVIVNGASGDVLAQAVEVLLSQK